MRCDIRRRDRRIIFLAGDVDRLVSIVDFHDGIARIPCKLTYLFNILHLVWLQWR